MTPQAREAARPDLTVDEIDTYRRRGYVARRGVLNPDEVASLREEADRLFGSPTIHPDNLRTHVLNATERAPDRLDPVIDLSPPLAALANDARLTIPVGQLLGNEPLLFKDKLIFKPPGMKGYLTHQDYAYWQWLPAPADAVLTVLVALDGAGKDNGAVEFFPGIHDRQLTPAGAPADVDESSLTVAPEMVDTQPGDVVIFHSLTPHRSGQNSSDRHRRQFYLSYSSSPYGDLYRTYYDRLHGSIRDSLPPHARERAFFR